MSDTSGSTNDNDDPTVISLTPAASIALVKSATVTDVNGNNVTDAGDEIAYTFTVENTGNVSLSDIEIVDPLLGGTVGTIASLAPGVTDASVTASYTILQSDMDSGNVTNTATATGDSPTGTDDVSDTSGSTNDNDDPTVTTLEQESALSVDIEVDVNEIDQVQVGDVITYTVVVENTGNTTLSGVQVSDELGLVEPSTLGFVGTLRPGEEATITYTYSVTETDIRAGVVKNQAFAEGVSPFEEDVAAESGSVVTVLAVDLIAEIEDELTEILEDDLRETTTKQSQLFGDIAKGARDRLADRSTEYCVAELNEFVASNPVLFDTALAILKPESGPVLDEIAEILGRCENGRIEIGGHTDSRGSDAYNLDLSQRRVNAVLAALGQRNVNTERLIAVGYGEGKPIADNSTVEGLARNRRVEFRSVEAMPEVQSECGTTSPFDIHGSAQAGAGNMDATGTFGEERYNCQSGVRQIVRGDFSLSHDEDFGIQAMITGTLQRERMISDDHLRGYFAGAYFSRSTVDTTADGEIDGYGLYGGVYGANRLEQDLYLDYYLAASVGRHSFDLRFSDALPEAIDADGSYQYVGLFGGLALSGEAQYGNTLLTPRAGVHLTYATASDADVTASIPGRSQTAKLSLEDQKGARLFGELGFTFGDTEKVNDTSILVEQVHIAPRLFCDTSIGTDTDTACGIGAGLEYSVTDQIRGASWGIDFDAETTGDTQLGTIGVFYEREIYDGNGHVRLGSSLNQGTPSTSVELETQW